MAESESGGVVFKSEDGTAYFIRDEVLEACKLEGEYLEAAKPLLEGEAEVQGFALSERGTQFTTVGSFASNPGIKVQTASPVMDKGKLAQYSTVMCPW